MRRSSTRARTTHIQALADPLSGTHARAHLGLRRGPRDRARRGRADRARGPRLIDQKTDMIRRAPAPPARGALLHDSGTDSDRTHARRQRAASRCSAITSTARSARVARAATFEIAQPGDERGHRARGRRPGGRRRRRGDAPRGGPSTRARGRGCPRRDRAGVLRRIANLIRERADDFIRARGARHGRADLAGARPRRARRAELRLLRRRRHRAARPLVPGRRRVPQLHDPQAGRRDRADHALERAADALDVAARAGARGRQHGRAQAGRVGARLLDAARRGARRGRAARRACSTSSTGSARRPARRSRRTPAST